MNLFAYLDPGSGSLIIQVIIGGILGFGVIIKTQWTRIKGLFSKLFGKNKKIETNPKSKENSDKKAE